MEVQKRLYTVDDVLALQGWDGTRDRKYELIDGELIEMSPTNYLAWQICRANLSLPRRIRRKPETWVRQV